MSKGFDYSKWDNIELSDDEADCHPNIDKESWFRMKHRSRVEREDNEDKDKAVIQAAMQKANQRIKVLEHDLAKLAQAKADDSDSDDDDLDDREGLEMELKQLQKENAERQAKLDEYEATLEKIQSRKAEYMAASQLSDPPVGGSFSETTLRSAVKAFVWRLIAGSVTFVTTLQFSGSLKQALQVVGADFFSKSFTMFIGERLMNKSQAGRKKGGDNAQRSLVKALVWRLFAICNTLTMAIFISKDLSIASKIASTDAVFKTALMFFYERVWARIGWGKEYLIEFSI